MIFMKKRWVGLLAACAMLCASAMPVSAEEILFTYDCSKEAANAASDVWATLKDDGVLTISGTGEMDYCGRIILDYEEEGIARYPWQSDYDKQVEKLIVEEGVTNITKFDMLSNLKAVYLPNSLERLGVFELSYCPNLETVVVSPGTTWIGPSKFNFAAENFKMYGYKDTYAEEYAAEYGYDFGAFGDMNADGELNLTDAGDIIKVYAQNASGTAAGVYQTAEEITAPDVADVNQDGAVNIDDASLSIKYYAKKAAGQTVDWTQLLTE